MLDSPHVSTAIVNPSSVQQERRTLLRLAAPILVTQLAQTGSSFVDTLMAGRLSALDLAAVALGSSLWIPLFLFMGGTLLATSPLVAQAFGAGRHDDIRHTAQQSLWLGLLLGCIGFVLMRSMAPVLDLMQIEGELRSKTLLFLDGLSWSLPAEGLLISLRCYSEALSRPLPVTVISLIGFVSNIFLDYVLMYGKFGLPALGGPGCGLATSLVMWQMTALLAWYIWQHSAYAANRPFHHWQKPQVAQMLTILTLGIPIGLAIFFEVSVFTLVSLFLSQAGAVVISGHQIAFNFASLAFMLPLSVSIALTVRIGHHIGAGDITLARYARRAGIEINIVLGLLLALSMVLLREPIVAMYTTDTAVADIAMTLLLFAALFQLSDALQVTGSGILRGLKDTRSPMLITLFAYWGVAIPVGYALGATTWLTATPWGANGYWCGLVSGLTMAAILLHWQGQRRFVALGKS